MNTNTTGSAYAIVKPEQLYDAQAEAGMFELQQVR
jgi:hypothetical protein